MYNFNTFLEDLASSTEIKFTLVSEDGTVLKKCEDIEKENCVRSNLCLGKSKAVLEISKDYENCISLLKYTIENKYKELFSIREQFFADILEGKEVAADKIEKSIPFLSKGCIVMIVNVDGSRYEALNIIRQLYKEQDVLSTIYGDSVVIIGDFEEATEHANSIRDSIVSELYCKCYVSLGSMIFNAQDIKRSYTEAKECMIFGRKFGIKQDVFEYEKMIFEKVVYNISHTVKQELLKKVREKLNSFDSEMITTIEEFVNCDLNISDAARKLYIHRNTLIYRLDKINKETGFDIRNFKDATVFIIAFLVWKESKEEI